MEPYIGQLQLFGFNFAPKGWALCNGQLLSIMQYQALFSLISTTYGGDGRTTFALPDLRGRVPNGQGQGPGLSNYVMGQVAGTENVTLLSTQMPAHNHILMAFSDPGNVSNPQGALLASSGGTDPEYRTSGAITAMGQQGIGVSGGNQPHYNMQPYLTMNYCIATEGIFPSRN